MPGMYHEEQEEVSSSSGLVFWTGLVFWRAKGISGATGLAMSSTDSRALLGDDMDISLSFSDLRPVLLLRLCIVSLLYLCKLDCVSFERCCEQLVRLLVQVGVVAVARTSTCEMGTGALLRNRQSLVHKVLHLGSQCRRGLSKKSKPQSQGDSKSSFHYIRFEVQYSTRVLSLYKPKGAFEEK